jgi:ribosomal protein L34/ribonuclease P protein component
MKRQYQPSKRRRQRQHGFLSRNSSKSGRAILRNRRRQGRKRLTPVWTQWSMAAEPRLRLRFGRSARLKRGRDFARLRQTGQRRAVGCLLANWQVLPAGAPARLGVITSGKIGNAVVRSRARRLLREAFRLHQHDLAKPLELVLVARASIAGKGLAQVEQDFLITLRKAGLLKPT